ncbi:MAG: glycerol-3-phosphate 1-O-acyltransferase PlsY [Armatimonadota bacterium]
MILVLVALVLAYLLGSVPVGLWLGYAKGVDLRSVGSRNIGASNVLRTLGTRAGLAVFALDVLKGALGVLVCKVATGWAAMPPSTASAFWALGGLCAVLGHDWSLFLKFKGGKGVASTLGAALVLDWRVASIGFGIWVVLTAATRFISLASMVGTLSTPFLGLAFRSLPAAMAFFVVASALVVARHYDNIQRLLAGEETRIGHRISEESARKAGIDTSKLPD